MAFKAGTGVIDLAVNTGPLRKAATLVRSSMAAIAGAASIGAVVVTARKFVAAAETQAEAQAKLLAVYRATQGTVGITVRELAKHAAALQKVTRYGDEATIAMQSMLLTFTNVRGTNFRRATELIQDVAAALDYDLVNAARLVGRALNDPTTGMTMLTRVGITFTEKEKGLIKELLKTNRAAEAQAVIMDSLEGKFKGVARAMAQTYGGQVQQLKNLWGDITEEIGFALIPAMADLLSSIKTIGDSVQATGTIWDSWTIGITEATAALSELQSLVKGMWYTGKLKTFEIGQDVLRYFQREAKTPLSTLAMGPNNATNFWAGLVGRILPTDQAIKDLQRLIDRGTVQQEKALSPLAERIHDYVTQIEKWKWPEAPGYRGPLPPTPAEETPQVKTATERFQARLESMTEMFNRMQLAALTPKRDVDRQQLETQQAMVAEQRRTNELLGDGKATPILAGMGP